MKLTLVVQRYGQEVVGGAERLCRGVAEGLAPRHDLEVVTTCALSYRTWANHYAEGGSVVNGVRVRRFRTERERDLESFNALSEKLFSGNPRTPEQELAWIDAQGPYAPALVDHLHAVAADRDLLLFFTYLYHPTVHGIHAAPERAVLAPAAHDEAPFWMESYRSVFTLPRALIFNTKAEQRLVRQRFPEARQPQQVIGVGIENLDALEAARRTAIDAGEGREAATSPVVLYAGRIDAGKGVPELLEHVRAYRAARGADVRVQLMGEVAMELPVESWIEALGFVSESEKARRLAAATVLVAPSALESFGIVLLEAAAAGTPTLANGHSEAYVEHCMAGHCGLWYRDRAEFTAALDLLLGDPRLRETLARDGAAYVRQGFSWEAVARRYERFLEGVLAGG